ncbi:MAG: L,D-transpeptidase [Gemmatimonadaceae bacterium]|nr:L,D-transpeptidase [Gemmatimonadaceae bacterium]
MATMQRSTAARGWVTWAAGAVAAISLGVLAFEGQRTIAVLTTRNTVRATGARERDAVSAARRTLAALEDSVRLARGRGAPAYATPYIIVSLADNRLWVRDGQEELFTTRVASGSGRTLVASGRSQTYRFDTPRGRLTVLSKETSPAWVPPDWHFVEQAGKKKLGILRMKRGQVIPVSDGVITTRGSDVVKRHRDGSITPMTASDGRELAAGGKIIIPPFGTNARRYKEILGTHRLNLGDGYALHGTNAPNTIGRSVSHGCVRLRNEDIETLYRMIPVGAPVYIY